jgi:pilus assembly protein CpaC
MSRVKYSIRSTFILLAASLALLLGSGFSVRANEVTVFVSEGEMLTFSRPVKNIFLAEKTIADIQVADDRRVFVFGQKPGRTTLIALDSEGRRVAKYSIVVTYNSKDLMRLIRKDVGDVPVEISYTKRGAVLRGHVQTREMAEKIKGLAQLYAGDGIDFVNQLKVTGSEQVHLKVRVAEVSRNVVRDLGINWDAAASSGAFAFGLATGRPFKLPDGSISRLGSGSTLNAGVKTSGLDINSVIDALASDGLVKILAEPNLTAASGQKATFLAGGEFPIPVPQPNNQVGVQFRQFGVSLEFTPNIISDDIISIAVRPEVSDISSQGATVVNGSQIPSLTTRRVETTIELGSGQSIVIGGLLQNRTLSTVRQFPVLGELPVIGALFRSTSFQRNESELIIIVTPYIARPAGSPSELQLPTDTKDATPDSDIVLLDKKVQSRDGAVSAGGLIVNGSRIKGNAGFIFE